LITGFFGYNLGIKTLLGANWGSQTYTYRIREERERGGVSRGSTLLVHLSHVGPTTILT
jgi:hypothetical protein